MLIFRLYESFIKNQLCQNLKNRLKQSDLFLHKEIVSGSILSKIVKVDLKSNFSTIQNPYKSKFCSHNFKFMYVKLSVFFLILCICFLIHTEKNKTTQLFYGSGMLTINYFPEVWIFLLLILKLCNIAEAENGICTSPES